MSSAVLPLDRAVVATVPALAARACPHCQTNNAQRPVLPYSRGSWRLKECGRCQLVYLENPPSYEALEVEYAFEKTLAAERSFRRQRSPWAARFGMLRKLYRRFSGRYKMETLVRRFVRPGSILDVGCGHGGFLVDVQDTYRPYGIEISQALAARASQRLAAAGRVVHACALEGFAEFPDGWFTGVLMRAYLEHEVQPRQVLAEAWRVLEPGGKLVIKVPNFDSVLRLARGRDWSGFRFPDHVTYFTPRTLLAMLAEAGFNVVRFRLQDRLPTSDNMWLVAAKPA